MGQTRKFGLLQAGRPLSGNRTGADRPKAEVGRLRISAANRPFDPVKLRPVRQSIEGIEMRVRHGYLGIGVALVLLAGCGLFPEASFDLSPESRIPNWFHQPAGVPRSAMAVTLDYYVVSSGRWARITMKTTNGKVLLKAKGTIRGTEPLHVDGVSGPSGAAYPAYEVVTVNGVSDIVEHRSMAPVFYMVDDATVWKALGLPARQ
jgi:hypothetical protein